MKKIRTFVANYFLVFIVFNDDKTVLNHSINNFCNQIKRQIEKVFLLVHHQIEIEKIISN